MQVMGLLFLHPSLIDNFHYIKKEHAKVPSLTSSVTLCMNTNYGNPLWDPNLGPQFGTPIWDPNLGPRFWTPILDPGWDPDLGGDMGGVMIPRYGTSVWDPDLVGDLVGDVPLRLLVGWALLGLYGRPPGGLQRLLRLHTLAYKGE
jgi:hypothetical protein